MRRSAGRVQGSRHPPQHPSTTAATRRIGPEAALEAAKCYYLADRLTLARKYVDLAAAALGTDDAEVVRCLRLIEQARSLPTTSPGG